MPAPKTVEEAATLVDGWIATLNTMAATDPARAVRNALHKANVLENMGFGHMPDGWGFGGPHLIEKLRQTARDIKAAQPTPTTQGV